MAQEFRSQCLPGIAESPTARFQEKYLVFVEAKLEIFRVADLREDDKRASQQRDGDRELRDHQDITETEGAFPDTGCGYPADPLRVKPGQVQCWVATGG